MTPAARSWMGGSRSEGRRVGDTTGRGESSRLPPRIFGNAPVSADRIVPLRRVPLVPPRVMTGGASSPRIEPVMKRFGSTMLALGVLVNLSAPAVAADGESLFNGKDFTGWKVPKDNIWWKVVDGTIVVENGPKKKGSTLWTEKAFKNFELELEFMCGDNIDSGVFLRTEKQQIQIGVSGSLKRDMTCSPYIPGRGYPVEAEKEPGTKGVEGLLKFDAWNAMKIRAVGPKYTVWLNGKQVLDFDASVKLPKDKKTPAPIPEEGPVGLQLHGNKVMKIAFREIKVTGL